MRLDIKGMEDIESTITDRLVTKLSDFMEEDQRKKLFEEIARNSQNSGTNSRKASSHFDQRIA